MDFLKPYGAVPSQRQMDHFRIEKKAFFHFGVNTFTNLEWGDGTEIESVFNPVGCDCRQWIRAIKAAGFKLAIITAKHHDGFCLWPSKYTEHSVKNSPYKDGKGDILREFVDACHEYDVKVGFYLSPWDRNAPYWGTAEYSKFYNLQLTELLTNYGRIDEIWWDGAGSRDTPYDWGLWAYSIRNLQPHAAIFGAQGATPYVELRWVGNESGYAGNPCYSTIDLHTMEIEDTGTLNTGVPDGELFRVPEVDVSSRPGWFFHEDQEDEVKTVSQMVRLWFDSVGSNCNLLLNFPPDRTGHLREKDISNALEAHQIITRAKSWNYALNAEASCDAPAREGYAASNMLNTFDDSFFAPEGTTASVLLKLPKKARINMFEIAEVIELGQRARGFSLEALVDGEWKTVYEGQSIGYKWAAYFSPVETDAFRLNITKAAAVPLIRFFGLYHIDEDIFVTRSMVSGADLTKGKSARLLPTSKRVETPKGTFDFPGVEVEFGGVYPFNTVCFNGEIVGHYLIEAFDGSNYATVYEGSRPHRDQVVTLPETIRGSYKMRMIVFSKQLDIEALNISVFER